MSRATYRAPVLPLVKKVAVAPKVVVQTKPAVAPRLVQSAAPAVAKIPVPPPSTATDEVTRLREEAIRADIIAKNAEAAAAAMDRLERAGAVDREVAALRERARQALIAADSAAAAQKARASVHPDCSRTNPAACEPGYVPPAPTVAAQPAPTPAVVVPKTVVEQATNQAPSEQPVTVQVPRSTANAIMQQGGTAAVQTPDGGSLIARVAPSLVVHPTGDRADSEPADGSPSYLVPLALVGGGLLLWLVLK